MNKAVPWSIKGVDFDAREAAKEAARRDGLTLGEWMNRAISDRAAEIGVPAQEFNADERLEAVAAQLARLSRESDADGTPHRRRGEARRSDRQTWREEPFERPREDGAPPFSISSAPAAPERPRARIAADPEVLLGQAVAAFETQAGRVEAGAAKAFAHVATLIEKSESARAGKLNRLDERLAEIETRLREPARSGSARPQAAGSLAATAAEPAPGAACDEQFSHIERRFESLIERLDRPQGRVPAPPRRDLEQAISAIEARQHELDAYPRLARTPPLATLIEQRFEALNRRLDRAPQGGASVREEPRETASSSEIEALARQVATMSRALEDVAPRSQMESLESALRGLGESVERSRDDGLRETVLAQIESLARDLRGAVARAGAADNLDGIASQLHTVEGKLDELLRAGWADRAEFRKVQDKSDELRAAIAAAIDHMAPIERIEQQIAALARRLEDLTHQAAEAGRAQETRLDDLAARMEGAGGEARIAAIPPTLEPLLRALAEKLDLASAPQADARALEALERQVAQVAAQVSEKLFEKQEGGEPAWGPRLEAAITDLASRFEHARETEHDAAREALREAMAGLPEIAALRDEHRTSDLRAQKTLSAVHETLEKVVDRLAMLEDEMFGARLGQGERAPDRAASGPSVDAFDRDDFLVEPGAGRPDIPVGEAGVEARIFPDDVFGSARPSPQSNYIEVARRALAARAAADRADKEEAEQRKRARAGAANDGVGFVRPLAPGDMLDAETGVKAKRRMPALLAMAGAVLALGAWQTYRIFDFAPRALTDAAPVSSVDPANETHASAAIAPADDKATAKAAVDVAPPVPDAPTHAAQTPAFSPPAVEAPALDAAPSAPQPSPKAGGQATGPGAVLVDPLAVGSIKPRANTMSSLQMALLKELAAKGDTAAQFEMGARLLEGRGFNRDPAAAIGWFEKASAQGLAPAQFRLGGIYEKGAGVPRDPAKARDYYEKAAALGHVRAMHNLAVMQAEGVDGKPDYATAAQWFRRAAEYGVRDSQYNLAILYARGLGVTQNLAQSFVWFDLASRQGDEDAARKRDEVAAQLDAPTLAAARKQADDFRARTPAPAVNDPPATPTGAAAASVLGPNLAKVLGAR
jgi:localization factor PodJL